VYGGDLEGVWRLSGVGFSVSIRKSHFFILTPARTVGIMPALVALIR